MIERFEGDTGRRLLLDALSSQKIVAGSAALAEELAASVALLQVEPGEVLIEQDTEGNEVFLILTGAFDVTVNGRKVGRRGPSDHVGEMAAIEPTQRRAATLVAAERSVVGKLTEPQFHEIANKYPNVYRYVGRELARRLQQRNQLVGKYRDKIRVFIISSAEALPVARAIQDALQYDPFTVVIWTDGVFRIANYTLQSLEDQVDNSDFAIAIAHTDDLTVTRGQEWPAPRDNVIFELGLFMGRLGRARAILMEPREEKVKLPSDLSGVTTISYRFVQGPDAPALIAPACNQLRDYIKAMGPNN
ncbi:TIR domain-containing protein [Bradyrhizobium sp. 17]|uniref:TIR domain-containing protein n=1 Tax=Bradyrhizobium sp. 17 TaxID=2782649 RepID=UPI001FFA33D4|nr:TIR domain-containing protein [Bradyrhizobium sp. 17]MCK1524743.1 nucleotide-binding protein [Bradyrhizobium sp. 17]